MYFRKSVKPSILRFLCECPVCAMEESEKEPENEPEIEKKAELDKKLETPVEDNSASDAETGDKKNGLEEKEDNGKNEST